MNSTKPNDMRKKIAVTALIVTLGMAVVGSGFPTYVSAETSGKATVANSTSPISNPILIDADGEDNESNQVITHGDVTLSLSNVIFDGNSLEVTVRKEGGTVGKEIIDLKKGLDLSANGKPIVYTPNLKSIPGDKGGVLISFSRYDKPQLPDQFVMTLKLYSENVKEPFTFTVPVKKAKSLVTLQPGTTLKSGDFSYTVDYFQLTPITMMLKLHSTGKVPAAAKSKDRSSKMFYEIADETGNVLGASIWDSNLEQPSGSKSKEDLIFSGSFNAVPKTIIIRPFSYTLDAKGKILKDSQKNWAKTYHKKLEMKITVPK
ncbi:DUF4179 domain-containing protein [Paenibacillus sp. IHBB 10380]|uniref:DUF4179 domain-containing protein n=1 Tax=Paenibacillus sp. IHBB 10380 TaxID=1566358 RepID=UPI0005CFD926|nr:DUF4179 domain-containing protein [Paenibacillus sp. IHBB 10380]AJS58651.1 hypothetical protein UB51_09305 [Paenibacillus sp. IHBB 10380]